MKPLFLTSILALTSCSSTRAFLFEHGEGQGNLAVEAGKRSLAESEFDALDSPPLFGLEWDAYDSERPIGYEVGLHHHRESETLPVTGRTELESTELTLGLRKTFESSRLPVRPYLGGGVSAFYTDRQDQIDPIVGETGSDFDTGFYLRAGAYAHVYWGLFLGLDFRYIRESDFEHGGYDLDGWAITGRIGWSF